MMGEEGEGEEGVVVVGAAAALVADRCYYS